ncbi:MAG: aldose 1-epimerase family protein [Ferruginibacter sp.]
MEFLENGLISIRINPKGAELTSLYDKTSGTEYMWSGDPAFWGKHSPVLFPIVGTLKEDRYFFEGRSYQLGRHGFARDMTFSISSRTNNKIVFSIATDAATLQHFPFDFRLEIGYELEEKKLTVSYRISNAGNGPMYFSIGGHPAFALPIEPGTRYEDYYLAFEKEEQAGRWPISKDGLIETTPLPLLAGTKLELSKELFSKDALVFKHLHSSSVQLASGKTSKGFRFDFPGFPYLGIWAAKGADFVCIEPWCGIADSVNSNQDLTEKEGINRLDAGALFERSWCIELF